MTDEQRAGSTTSEPDAAAMVDLSRVLDEIRGDTRWRDEIAALRRGQEAATDDAERDDADSDEPPPALSPPASDTTLDSLVSNLDTAIGAAAAEIDVLPGRPVVGTAWAAIRRQIHREIRIGLDRQAIVNADVLAILRRIEAALDPGVPDSVVGETWRALGELDARLSGITTHLATIDARLRVAEESLGIGKSLTLRDEINSLGQVIAAELEPIGQIRLAVDALERRLTELEHGRAD